MDKPIISTPIKVEMPEGLQYLEVSDDPDLFEVQLEEILRQPESFQHLSNRSFFQQKLHPCAQVDYILRTIGYKL